MVKQIRFHLVIEGNTVRSVDELQGNFNLQEVLTLYRRGVLGRWLKAHGEDDLFEKVSSIGDKDDQSTLMTLINIFKMDEISEQVDSACAALNYFTKRKEMLELFDKHNQQFNGMILSLYHQKYEELKQGLIDDGLSLNLLKQHAGVLARDYYELIKLEWPILFDLLKERSPLALVAFLCDCSIRESLIGTEARKNFFEYFKAFSFGAPSYLKKYDDRKLEVALTYCFANNISNISEGLRLFDDEKHNQDLNSILNGTVKCFRGETNTLWKDLADKNKKIIVVYLPHSSLARSSGVIGEDIDFEQICEEPFPVLEGLNYQSTTWSNPIIYVEAD